MLAVSPFYTRDDTERNPVLGELENCQLGNLTMKSRRHKPVISPKLHDGHPFKASEGNQKQEIISFSYPILGEGV